MTHPRIKRKRKRFLVAWGVTALVLELGRVIYSASLALPLDADPFLDKFLYWYPHQPENYLALLIFSMLLSTLGWVIYEGIHAKRRRDRCDRCGYLFAGLSESGVCPECGEAILVQDSAGS